MLKNLVEKLKKYSREPVSVDPSRFNDPIAIATSWSPAKSGGTNFRTHTLVLVDPDRIEFKASVGARIFYLVFLLSGLGVLIFVVSQGLSSEPITSWPETLVPLLVGTVFAIGGICLFYSATAPIVFDKRRGFFWKGRQDPSQIISRNDPKHFAKFGDIHTLQIISEFFRSEKSSYYSYELNLVLTNGTRINIIDHGNLDRIRKNSQTLATFLTIPVWDATLNK